MAVEGARLVALKRVPITRVLRKLSVELPAGDVTQQLPCPVHKDSRPSARLYVETNSLHCFTCGRSWDALSIVAAIRQEPLERAAQWLEVMFPRETDAPTLVRDVLKETPADDVEPLIAYAESRLIEARERLGCDRFSRLCVALDVAEHRWRTKEWDTEQLRDLVRSVVKSTRPTLPPS